MDKKKRFIIVMILVLMITVISATYAYKGITFSEKGNGVGINVSQTQLTVSINRELPSSITTQSIYMVPQTESSLLEAINNGGDGTGCIDSNGNKICQVDKITVTNPNPTNLSLRGTIRFKDIEKIPNLRWQLLELNGSIYSLVGDSHEAGYLGEEFATLELGRSSQDYYIVYFINEPGFKFNDEGQFTAIINFTDANGGVTSTVDSSTSSNNSPNRPNLVNNNLIPVYFDDDTDEWKKADSDNSDNSWYDYENKMWANAVLVSDTTRRSYYNSAGVDTVITESDITAFYVWIPRFKYRVWDISRQRGVESTYSYPAYSKGIDIVFESGTGNTGNVSCTYNINSSYALNDECYVTAIENTEPVMIYDTTSNSKYTNAWYTHPAFTLGNDELTGFWMGKFETTGSVSSPTILPNEQSLRNKSISNFYAIGRSYDNILGSTANSHMLMNTEWGAVAYLSHSKYGLCDDYLCVDSLFNNSSDYYTGRSGGGFSNSNVALSTGTFDYKGNYLLNNNSSSKYKKRIASTTNNITGIYDMSGGAWEYLMAAMPVDGASSSIENSVTGSFTNLENKFYNIYKYGTEGYRQAGFNKSRLGDATAEVTFIGGTLYGAWQHDGEGATTLMVNMSNIYFLRGGANYSADGGLFSYNSYPAIASDKYSFRMALSPTSTN